VGLAAHFVYLETKHLMHRGPECILVAEPAGACEWIVPMPLRLPFHGAESTTSTSSSSLTIASVISAGLST
jgi:hypothetical protein